MKRRVELTHSAYRRKRRAYLAKHDLCGICGHGGAMTIDHVDPFGPDWESNWQPAHGTLGPRALNPCPTCGRLCNQSKGNRPLAAPSPRSQDW